MGEKEIQQYLNKHSGQPKKQMVPTINSRRQKEKSPEGYGDFSASHLYCPTCKKAMPVKERIMLYLPDGDMYEFKCTGCGSSVGTKKDSK